MQPAAESKKEWKLGWILLFLTLPLYVVDQWTKFWTIRTFPHPSVAPEVHIPVIEGFFNLRRVHNQGVAFGFGNGSDWAPVVFLIVPLVALTLITLGVKKKFFIGNWGLVAVGLLLCGIFGNLTDRLIQGSLLEEMQGEALWTRLKAGYVVDFLDFTIPVIHYQWPCFNVADSCIFVAAFVLFFTGLKADLKKAD